MKALTCCRSSGHNVPQFQRKIINFVIKPSTNTSLQNSHHYPTFILLRTYAKPKNSPVIHKDNTPTLTYIHKKNKPKLQKEAFKRERREELSKLGPIVDDAELILPQLNIPVRSSPRKLKQAEEDEDLLFNRALLKAQEYVSRPEEREEEDATTEMENAEKEGQLLEQELQEEDSDYQQKNAAALVAREERDKALAAKHQWLNMTLDKPIVQLVKEQRYQEAEMKFLNLSSKENFRPTPQIFQAMLECFGKMKQPEKIHALIASNVKKQPSKEKTKLLLPAIPQQTFSLDAMTYESIIKALGACGDVSLMMNYFHEMVNVKQIKPSLMTMNSMIHSYAAIDDPVSVDKCFKLLKQSGLRPNVHTYDVIMEYFEKKGDLKMVANYHDLMVKQGVEPTVDTWRTLAKACRKSFEYDVWNLKQTRGVWHLVKRAGRKRWDFSEVEQQRMKRLLANFKALVQDL